MTVRFHFEVVNKLISRVQISKNKNKTSKAKLATISYTLQNLFLQMRIVEAGQILLYMQKN